MDKLITVVKVISGIQNDFSQFEGQGLLCKEEIQWMLEYGLKRVSHFLKLGSFQVETYDKHSLYKSNRFEVALISWLPGQRSTIHDHGESSCGFVVLDGDATESFFQRSQGGFIYPAASRVLSVGSSSIIVDNSIHQVANLQLPNVHLSTFHVYSPPLCAMNMYDLNSRSENLDPQLDLTAN